MLVILGASALAAWSIKKLMELDEEEKREEIKEYESRCSYLEDEISSYESRITRKRRRIKETARISKLLGEIEVYIREIEKNISFLEEKKESLDRIRQRILNSTALEDEKYEYLNKIRAKKISISAKIRKYKKCLKEYETLDKDDYYEVESFKEKLEEILQL